MYRSPRAPPGALSPAGDPVWLPRETWWERWTFISFKEWLGFFCIFQWSLRGLNVFYAYFEWCFQRVRTSTFIKDSCQSLLDRWIHQAVLLPRSSPFFRTGREARTTQFQVAFYVISLSYWGISLELGLVILEHQNRVRDLLILDPSWPPLSFWFDILFCGMIYNPF